MSEMLIIIEREFRERVRSRAFVLGTVLFPVFMAVLLILPNKLGAGGGHRRLVLVDEAPAGVGDRFVAALTTPPGVRGANTDNANTYTVERVPGTLVQLRARLTARVAAKEIDGYVVLPADVLDRNQVIYRARNVASMSVIRDLGLAASRAVQGERLRAAGLDATQVAKLIRPAQVESARLGVGGAEAGSALSTFIVAYVVAFLIYFMTFFYGVNVMRSVLEEKTSRIAEVMVSSVGSGQLMAGKIIGVGAAAVLQVAIWGALAVYAATRSDTVAARLGIPPDAMRALTIDPGVGIAMFLFFLLGFFLYAALFAALGASVTTDQEAQSLQMVIIVPLLAPLLSIAAITGEPLGPLATVFGLIPFTAPIAMPMRMAASPIPAAQVVASMVILAASIALVAWLAGKIYRIGILSTGKKPTLGELAQWLRAA